MKPRLGKKLMDEPEDLAAYRARRTQQDGEDQSEEEKRWRDWAEEVVEENKDNFAAIAFADAFEDIVREVTRVRPTGTPGVVGFTRFFEMLERGAIVEPIQLAVAALQRIYPDIQRLDANHPDRQAIAVARAGLGFLIEARAYDGLSAARLRRRRHHLCGSIKDYVDALNTRHLALENEWAELAQIMRPTHGRKRKTAERTSQNRSTAAKSK